MLDKSHIGKWFRLRLDKIDPYNDYIINRVDMEKPYAKLIAIKYPDESYVFDDGFNYLIRIRSNNGCYWESWAYEEWLETMTEPEFREAYI